MNAKVRLYRRHDLDLIALHLHSSFSLKKAIILSLKRYAQGEPIKYIPPHTEYINPKNIKSIYSFNLKFDETKDKEIVDWFKKIQPRYRNAAIKMTIRASLCFALVALTGADATLANEQAKINNNAIIPGLEPFPYTGRTIPKEISEYRKKCKETSGVTSINPVDEEDIKSKDTNHSKKRKPKARTRKSITPNKAAPAKQTKGSQTAFRDIEFKSTTELKEQETKVQSATNQQDPDDSFDLFSAVSKLL